MRNFRRACVICGLFEGSLGSAAMARISQATELVLQVQWWPGQLHAALTGERAADRWA